RRPYSPQAPKPNKLQSRILGPQHSWSISALRCMKHNTQGCFVHNLVANPLKVRWAPRAISTAHHARCRRSRGPIGSGKTALIERRCKRLCDSFESYVITNYLCKG